MSSKTSLAAKKSMEPHITTLQKRVLILITMSGEHGATCDELEEQTVLRHQTLSARVRELYTGGWIYRTKRTRRTRSGRQAVVYRTRRERKQNTTCMCDRPTCSRQPCKQLREYRITHRVISEVFAVYRKVVPLETVEELLTFIEVECEILVK